MRNFVFITIAAFSLAACSGVVPKIDPVNSANLTADIKAVQSYTQTACKFVPTVATVVEIFNAAIGEGIATIGKGLCDALAIAPLADGPGKDGARYRGVLIRGTKAGIRRE